MISAIRVEEEGGVRLGGGARVKSQRKYLALMCFVKKSCAA